MIPKMSLKLIEIGKNLAALSGAWTIELGTSTFYEIPIWFSISSLIVNEHKKKWSTTNLIVYRQSYHNGTEILAIDDNYGIFFLKVMLLNFLLT